MAKRNRPSVLKREREQKKRMREVKKAEKAALKRARRDEETASLNGNTATDTDDRGGVPGGPPSETGQ